MIVVKQENKLNKIRMETKELIKNIENDWFNVSKHLMEIYQEKLYEYWDYENFKEYLEEELHIEYRTAMYRIAVIKSIYKYSISPDIISNIGWTKYKTIMPFFSEDNEQNDKLIELAENLSVRELESKLNKNKNSKNSFKLVINLNEEQKTIIEDAIEKAKELWNVNSNDLAFENIITDWLSNYN